MNRAMYYDEFYFELQQYNAKNYSSRTFLNNVGKLKYLRAKTLQDNEYLIMLSILEASNN